MVVWLRKTSGRWSLQPSARVHTVLYMSSPRTMLSNRMLRPLSLTCSHYKKCRQYVRVRIPQKVAVLVWRPHLSVPENNCGRGVHSSKCGGCLCTWCVHKHLFAVFTLFHHPSWLRFIYHHLLHCCAFVVYCTDEAFIGRNSVIIVLKWLCLQFPKCTN